MLEANSRRIGARSTSTKSASQEVATTGNGLEQGSAADAATENAAATRAAEERETGQRQSSRRRAWGQFRFKKTKGGSCYKRRADLPKTSTQEQVQGPDDPALDASALRSLQGGVYTVTAGRSTAARVAWWKVRAEKRVLNPFLLTCETLT